MGQEDFMNVFREFLMNIILWELKEIVFSGIQRRLFQEKQMCSRYQSDSIWIDSRQEDRDQEGEAEGLSLESLMFLSRIQGRFRQVVEGLFGVVFEVNDLRCESRVRRRGRCLRVVIMKLQMDIVVERFTVSLRWRQMSCEIQYFEFVL